MHTLYYSTWQTFILSSQAPPLSPVVPTLSQDWLEAEWCEQWWTTLPLQTPPSCRSSKEKPSPYSLKSRRTAGCSAALTALGGETRFTHYSTLCLDLSGYIWIQRFHFHISILKLFQKFLADTEMSDNAKIICACVKYNNKSSVRLYRETRHNKVPRLFFCHNYFISKTSHQVMVKSHDHVLSKTQLRLCFATGEQLRKYPVILYEMKITFIFSNTMKVNKT